MYDIIRTFDVDYIFFDLAFLAIFLGWIIVALFRRTWSAYFVKQNAPTKHKE